MPNRWWPVFRRQLGARKRAVPFSRIFDYDQSTAQIKQTGLTLRRLKINQDSKTCLGQLFERAGGSFHQLKKRKKSNY